MPFGKVWSRTMRPNKIVLPIATFALIGFAGLLSLTRRTAEPQKLEPFRLAKALRPLGSVLSEKLKEQKASQGRAPAAAGPVESLPVDYPLTLNFNPVVRANQQVEAVVTSPAPGLPPSVRIIQATFQWSLDPSIASRCGAAAGGPLSGACISGGGFSTSVLEGNRELGTSGRMIEFPADLAAFGSPQGVTLYFFATYLTEDTANGRRVGIAASPLASMQIVPGTAKLYTEPGDAAREAAFAYPLPAPRRDMSLSADGQGEIWISTTGNDANPGTFAQPVLTLGRAKAIARSRWPNESARAGKSIIFRGGTYINGRGATFRRYDLAFSPETYYNWNGIPGSNFKIRGYWADREPVVIDNHAYDPKVIYGDPGVAGATDPYAWQDKQLVGADHAGNYGASISNTQNLTFEGITIYGAFIEGLDIDNTRNVQVRFVNIYGASKWGMQAFGQNVHNLEITGCKVMGTLLEHGIYIAAGAHGPELGGPIMIHHNELAYNGRNGIQVNGAHEWVRIENNLVYRNYLAGIASTGNANVQIKDNFVAENLKQGITLLMYVDDSYWDRSVPVTSPGDYRRGMLDWRTKHFASMGPTFIRNNTIVIRPEVFDSTTNEHPSDHGAIDVAQWEGYNTSLGDYAHHAFRELRIENNRIHTVNVAAIRTQIDQPELDFRGIKTIRRIRATGNRVYATGGNALFCTPFASQWCLGGDMRPIAQMQADYPAGASGFGWSGNSTALAFSSMPPVPQLPVGAGRVDIRFWSDKNPLKPANYVNAP